MAATLVSLAEEASDVAQKHIARIPSMAPQRFASTLTCVQRFVKNAAGCVRFLCMLASTPGDVSAKWAQHLLDFISRRNHKTTMQNALLLALVAEFMQSAHKFVRLMETGKSAEHHIARTAVQLNLLEKELSHLFDTKNSDGTTRLLWGM